MHQSITNVTILIYLTDKSCHTFTLWQQIMAGTGQERPAATFFTEEATRQILARISNVFDDPDLCDATFIVGDDNEKEEITAPSQFMALASPYFKKLFYPASGKQLLFLQIFLR